MKKEKKRKEETGGEKLSPVEKNFYNVFFLYLVCFLSGASVMTLEMLGFRLLAPYFGYSIYIWGSLIGIIMAALSCGYFIGGALADKFPRPWLMFLLILTAGFYTGVISFFYRPLLIFCQAFGLIFGSAGATVFLFSVPMLCLSTVSPFIIRLLAEKEKIGITAGKVYSISTMGSIMGTFLSSFFLIPVAGSHKTIIITAIVLILIGTGGLIFYRKKFFLILIILIPLFLNYPDPSYGEDVVLVKESPYSHIEVVKYGFWLCLKPQENFYHSLYSPNHIMTGNEWDYYCLAPLIEDKAEKVLILGMGGGTSVRQFLHFWPQIHIDALDIDPVVVDIATGMFEVPKDSPNLDIIIDDARAFLQKNKEKYDFIQIDLFNGGVFIPFYLTTDEFFSLVKEDLNPSGMIIMNINVTSDMTEETSRPTLFGSIGNTILKNFPSVFYIKLSTGNVIFLAFKEYISLHALSERLEEADTEYEELQKLLDYSKLNIKEYEEDKQSFVLTDDFCPVDELIYPVAVSNFRQKGEE